MKKYQNPGIKIVELETEQILVNSESERKEEQQERNKHLAAHIIRQLLGF